MFKKILSLSLIALMLFSFVSSIDATQSIHTLTVHARTQDNDGDGYVRFFNDKGKVYHEEFIRKGDTRTYDIAPAKKVDFHSVNRKNHYNADLTSLNLFNEYYGNNLANIYVDVNFYSKSCYYNNFRINKHSLNMGTNEYYAPMERFLTIAKYRLNDIWEAYL